MLLSTAGHIDHGKTSLVRALTGIDADRLDRLKEEQARGITIELGFAQLTLPSGRVAGVVDVPGHERFVRTMVAGASGVDLMLLVVAADEGMMPQTREHLDICELLGIPRAVVALSKCDLVDGELRALAVADVREALGGRFGGAAIIPCSAKTGEGLGELVAAIDARLDGAQRDSDGLLRLPVDRVFTMKGFGTVVTGTLVAGRVAVGDELGVWPRGGASFKARGVQVHGATVGAAEAGQRTALNLTVARDAIARGDVIGRAGELEAGRYLDARVRLLPSANGPLGRRTRVLFHAGTTQTLALLSLLDTDELMPGQSALGQLALAAPLVTMPGDRFVLRGFVAQRHHGTTLGGGEILRTLGGRLRRGVAATALAAFENTGVDERVALEVERAGRAGIARAALLRRVPSTPPETDAALLRLTAAERLVATDGDAWIATSSLKELGRAAVDALAEHHRIHKADPGMSRQELRERLGTDARLFAAVVIALGDRLVLDGESARLAAHRPATSQASPLAPRVEAFYRDAGLSPPSVDDAAQRLGAPLADIRKAVDVLAREKRLLRIGELWFAAAVVDDLRRRLTAFLVENATITAQQWKELTGVSRKFAIPLAEYFDAEKLTLRVGDLRRLRSGSRSESQQT